MELAELDDSCGFTIPVGDGNERIEVWKMTFEEALRLLDQHQIVNAGGRLLLEAFFREFFRGCLRMTNIGTQL